MGLCHKPNGQSHGSSANSFCSWDQALDLSSSALIHHGLSLVDKHCCVQDPDFETEGSVISCLQDFRDMLMESTCQDQVHKMMALAAEDIRFNQILSDACLPDRERFCKDTQQVTYRRCCSCQLVVLCIMLLCCAGFLITKLCCTLSWTDAAQTSATMFAVSAVCAATLCVLMLLEKDVLHLSAVQLKYLAST